MIWIIVCTIIAIAITVKVYQKFTCGICKSSVHMVGKTVLITGGNSGLGFVIAKDLAERGAKVIIACRNVRKAKEALDEIVKTTGNKEVYYRQLDLSSLRSVREFCDKILKTEKRLDVLINNAGALGFRNYITEDGLHIGMQVNYFGPFLLTSLLVPLLKMSAPSRIVNVSASTHKYGEVDFENLNFEKYWSDYLAYSNSKLFLNLMTLELSSRLEGSGVTVNALHPGLAATHLFRNIPIAFVRRFLEMSISFMFQSLWEAAQTTIYLAVSPKVNGVSGKYFCNCKEKLPSKLSRDPELAKRLWAESETLVKYTISD